jgi:hypothetical protein
MTHASTGTPVDHVRWRRARIALDLPEVLTRALTAELPGAPLPPGPRVNPWQRAGAVPVATPERLQTLFEGLWRSCGYHCRPDGTATTIRQRPVPSAGAAYPVHTHLVVGSRGRDGLDAGRYFYDHEAQTLLRRTEADEQAADWHLGGGRPQAGGSFLVLTVQPGRSFGRYRHRAWPLWIADAAYAMAAVEFLITEHLKTTVGPGAPLRDLLGVPRAASSQEWVARGLVPEIPLAAIELPSSWTLDSERGRALAARRSPGLEEFERAAAASCPDRSRDRRAAEVARLSGQGWVLGARRIETWSVPTDASTGQISTALWQAHRSSAAQWYEATLSRRWRCRPVSGIRAEHGRWTVHALAMLPGAAHTDEKGTA